MLLADGADSGLGADLEEALVALIGSGPNLLIVALETGETCIDCHKGIAHHLPDMSGVEGWQ